MRPVPALAAAGDRQRHLWLGLWGAAAVLLALVVWLCYRRNEPIDLEPVWLAVEAFLDGEPPYTSKRFIYPPSALLIFSPFGGISFDTARTVFLVVDAAAIAAGALFALRALRIPLGALAAPVLVALAAICAPTITTLRLENVNGLVLACECAFLMLALQGRWKPAGWALGASLAIKPVLFPLVVLPLLWRRWDALLRALALPALLSLAALVASVDRGDFFSITVPFLFEGNFPELETFNVALAGAGGILGVPDPVILLSRVAVSALALVLVWRRVRLPDGPTLKLVETSGIILVATFLAFSFSFVTYPLFLLPLGFSAVLPGAVARRAAALLALVLVAAPDRYVLHDLGIFPVEAITIRVTVGLLLLLSVFAVELLTDRQPHQTAAHASGYVMARAGGPEVLDVSVVIPTIGRPAQLRETLASLAACRPRAAEIIVVDQSGDGRTVTAAREFAASGTSVVRSGGRGIALAVNEGLAHASNEVVLATHDDCSVAPDWIAVGHRLASDAPACIITGRVLPSGRPSAVPSTKEDPLPHDFTGTIQCHVLFPSNMVLPRSSVLGFGAFDARFRSASEDNDLCYRWLRANRCLRYEPSLVVWHRDWRTPEELRRMYVRYWYEQGRFYAKHLRRGDLTMVRFLLNDARYMAGVTRAAVSIFIRRRQVELDDEARGLLLGLLPGMVRGWRDFRASGPAGP